MTFGLGLATPVPGDELQSGQSLPFPSDDAVCLSWTLQRPLEESVAVMQDKESPDPALEVYYERTLEGDSWHPISEKPVTKTRLEPPCRRIPAGLLRGGLDRVARRAHRRQ